MRGKAARWLALVGAASLGLFAAPMAASAQATPAKPPPGHGTPAAKAFSRPDLDSDAVRTRASLRKAMAEEAKGHTADDLFAAGRREAAKDANAAVDDFGGAIAAGRDDAAVWLELAKAAQAAAAASTEDGERKARLDDWALSSAYLSYQRASSRRDEATALAVLSGIYASRETWRPALDSLAASLAAREDPAVRTAYDGLRAEHGFRITDYKIDSDAASARACFQFSESLAKGRVDFASYVAVGGSANAAVTADDQQLCVEGLKHGQRYAVTLRQGLPSAVGESLLSAADYDLYVRDRSPEVHFQGRSYVLPRVGPEGIPVVSVNTAKIDVTILRIGDRGVAPMVRSDFLSQLYAGRFDALASVDGKQVWSGSLAVEPRLNEDVTTAFPVLDALGTMDPGLYVMQAKPHADMAGGGDAGPRPTQWFVVSDLGLTAFSGQSGVTALVRSLAGARPLAGVELRLVAKDNEVLARTVTDGAGVARFDPGLSRGRGGEEPALLVGSTAEGDYNLLDLAQAPFDLTDRGVAGRPAAKGLEALLYTERGVYRPGETVFVTGLLRGRDGQGAAGVPLTFVLKRPDGVEGGRVTTADAGLGGHALAMPLLAGATTGTWHVDAYVDPKGEAVGGTSFLVDDYLPERLSFDLRPRQGALKPGETVAVATATRFLYGAPGGHLDITGETVLEAADKPAWPALAGYVAGLSDEAFETVTTALPEPVRTDAEGLAEVLAAVPGTAATRPLEAKVVLRVGEPGGRAVERSVIVPVLPKTGLIGVKKTFGALGEGGSATFDVVTVDETGARSAKAGLRWSLYRLDNDYQWYKDGDQWSYERVKSTRRIADGALATRAEAPVALAAPLRFGQHRLDITSDDPALPPTSLVFDVGWSADTGAPTPDQLDVTLDRKDYAPGDALHVTIRSRFAGQATLAVANEGLRALEDIDLKVGDNSVAMPVGGDWGTGAYALVLAHRPLDGKARRMPGRALGLAWFSIGAADRGLGVTLDLPAKIRPRSTLRIPIRLAGLRAGEEARVSVSAVDVGILGLTRYETPKPDLFFFGQHALGTEVRDLYGLLIDGLGLARGAIRSGGDSAGELASEKPTQPPLARASGIVQVGADGTATVDFDIPAFNGTVRVAAVAWSRTRTGSAEADVVVRDPVVLSGTLPRFLNIGDHAQAHFDLDNVEGAAGAYTLTLDPGGPWVLPAEALAQGATIGTGARAGLDVPLTATGTGTAVLDARLTGPSLEAAQRFAIPIEAGSATVFRRDIRSIAPGATLTLSDDLLAEFVPGSGSLSLAVSPLGGIDVPALLLALDRYPVGCSEQIVSRALPLLSLSKLAPPQDLALDADLPARVDTAIATLLARQTTDGGFGLWSADAESQSLWLDGYVMDFLTRAREAGHAVPAPAFDAGLDRLRNFAANNADAKDDDALSLAYATYVLARNGRPVLGDLRYLAATRLSAFPTPLAQAQIGAALALLGDHGHAAEVFKAATASLEAAKDARDYRSDYGSRLRDAAGVLALAAESDMRAELVKAGDLLEEAQRAPNPTDTQEQAWMVLAAQAIESQGAELSLTLGGEAHRGPLYRRFVARRLEGKPVTLANTGAAPLRVVLTTSGELPGGEPAASHGYTMERRYYKMDGVRTDPSTVEQNDRLLVVLKVTEDEARAARLLLTDPLPAGFEIDNPDLVASGALPNMPDDVTDDVKPAHSEFRDDRFTAAFDRTADQPAFFTVAYLVRAVTPGRFVHPPATIEDMYRPERFGRGGAGLVEVRAAR